MDHQNGQSFYQTGYTHPPKSYRGIIALLLITIVILGSIATVLGLLNIQLFRKLSMQSEEAGAVQFAQLANAEHRSVAEDANALGLSVKTLSDFDQSFYQLPQGVYITNVVPGSRAAKQGIMSGDILISVQNIPITNTETLENYLVNCTPGQLLNLVLYRDGKQYSVSVVLGG